MKYWLTVLRYPDLRQRQWCIFCNALTIISLRVQIIWFRYRTNRLR